MLMYINWNVDPVFLNLGVIELRYYSCLFALGIFIGYNLVAKLYKLENIPQEKVYSLFVYAVLGIVIGARLGLACFMTGIISVNIRWKLYYLLNFNLVSNLSVIRGWRVMAELWVF